MQKDNEQPLKKNVSCTSWYFKIDRKRIRKWDSKYDALKHLNYGKRQSFLLAAIVAFTASTGQAPISR